MVSTVTGKIQVLPDAVSCRIAAGEVVERPASVVKELIDNSLDAGSSFIFIEIEDGGRRLIRVRDNGGGMTRTDAQLACQRFATSKLRTEEDLHTLTTLGFRGEALPSIASVSRFHLRTVPFETTLGTHIHSSGGLSWEVEDFTGPHGTQVEARDLFFNTPGRLKFLKTVPTEFSKICYVVQQSVAVHPKVHFKLQHHHHIVLEYPAVSTPQDRLLQLHGSAFLDRFLPVRHHDGPFELTGYTVNPHHARNSRMPQEIFVNGRAIKNTTISHAVYEAYGSFLSKGKHPHFILFLQLDPQTIDVNVHPAKREIRFSHPEVIHKGIFHAIKAVFFNPPSSVPLTNSRPLSPPSPVGSFPITPGPPPPSSASSASSALSAKRPSSLSLFVQEPPSLYGEQETVCDVLPLGQIHHTYLLGQIDQDLFIVDQHTAHERVLFEKLVREWQAQDILQQPLLVPEPVEFLSHQKGLFEEWLPALTQAGIELEPFGTTSCLIRAVPAILGNVSAGPLVVDLLEELSEWPSTDSLEKKLRPVFATMACHSAVQAGRSMTAPEIKKLLQDWAQENFPMTCPHGRRVAIRHPLEELHRMFARPVK